MDTRSVTADFYPGGRSAISAGGGITSGESGGGSGAPTVPVTPVAELPERYRESDMASKINEIARVISGGVALIAAMVSFAVFGQVQVQGVKNADLWNDDFVVTNVTVDLDGYARTEDVSSATNALDAAFNECLSDATNAVLSAAADEISAATNELARNIDKKLEASTNGLFDASMLEDYAKRGWVEAQGYLKETNMNSYAQVGWVEEQGFVRKTELESEVQREIALQDATGAYRLMIPDRSEWIDGSGVCWRVTSHLQVEDNSFVGKPGDRQWVKEDGNTRVGLSGTEWWYTRYKTWNIDPDDPESTCVERWWDYSGEANATGGVTTLTITVEDPESDENGSAPPETVELVYWLETNSVNRVAYTNDLSVYAKSEELTQAIAGMSTITTNDVCNIVTNEVGFTEWTFRCNVPAIQAALDANPPKVDIIVTDDPNVSYWVLHPLPAVSGYGANSGTMETVTDPDVNIIVFSQSYDIIEQGLTIPVTATRSRITRNELGLARMTDIEQLPTYEAVTNTARDVSNTFWDEKNSVLWKIAFKDGEPMFLPLTNENVSVTGGAQ